MKKIIMTVCVLLVLLANNLSAHKATPVSSITEINNFHFVSDNLASSGMLTLSDYQYIHDYGFKHVINLIPGMQIKEKRHVEKLGMSYQQIPVVWDQPTLENFQRFVTLMKSYGDEKVYIHCQLNWRASTFVFLYRVTQLGHSVAAAKKDLMTIWQPKDGWDDYIQLVLKAYDK